MRVSPASQSGMGAAVETTLSADGERDEVAGRVRAICPYIATAGGWRSANPIRDHLCTAVEPAALLAVEKQRRLCLVAEHSTCATYLAETAESADVAHRSARWPTPRTAAVIMERGRPSLNLWLGSGGLSRGRQASQLGLVGLMVAAFGILAIGRLTEPPAGDAADRGIGALPAASAAASVRPSAVAVVVTPRPSASAAPQPSPSLVANGSSEPTLPATGTYVVQRGDTLSSIAAHFGTTVKALAAANGITNPRLIRVGQVLKLPESSG